MREMMKKILPLVIILLISCLAVLPLFQPGFFPIHDNTQVARVHLMSVALSDGMFPVRWVSDLGYGYGYPIFNFYAPLAYYVGGLLVVIGLPALIATKLMIGIGMVLAAGGMYLLSRTLIREEGAVIAGILYMFAPYHAVNLYVRGAISELWAYAFLPLAIYGLVKIYQNKNWKAVILASLGLAGVILSHNLTAFMLIPFYGLFFALLLYKSLKQHDKQKSLFLVVGVLLGLMLSFFYFLPAFLEMGYTNVVSQTTGGSQYKDHFVCIEQLWASQWGFGGSTVGCLDGISFQIGKLHIFFALLGLVVGVLFFKKTKSLSLLSLSGILSVFLLLPQSKVMWDSIPQMAFLQFPWRYLQFIAFFFSLVGGFAISFLIEKYLIDKKGLLRWGLVVILISAILFLYTKNFKPQTYLTDYRDETNKEVIHWTVSKISDEYLPKDFNKPKTEQEVAKVPLEAEDVAINILSERTQYLKAQLTADKNTAVTVNKAYFPSWQFKINDEMVSPQIKDGFYTVAVPSGTSTLEVQFVETPIEKTANAISFIGVIVSVLGIILLRERKKTHAKTP